MPDPRPLYIDAVDEALRKSGKKSQHHRRSLMDIALRQMKLVARHQVLVKTMLIARRSERCPSCLRGKWTAQEVSLAVAASMDVTSQIEKLTRTIRDCDEAERKKMGGLNEDELMLVLSTQIPRIAKSMLPNDKRMLIALWFGEEVAKTLCPE